MTTQAQEKDLSAFALATVLVDNAPLATIKVDGRYWPIADVAPQLRDAADRRGLIGVLESWEHSEPELVAAAERLVQHDAPGALPTPHTHEILPPLLYSAKAIFTGYNYHDHITLDGGRSDFQKEAVDPAFLFKPPTTTYVGPGRSVPHPPQTTEFDYELELGVVIGKRARSLTPDNALDCVAGYTTVMDLSARDNQKNPRHPLKADVVGGKAFDNSCPIGPSIVPARFLDGQNLELRMSINGEEGQSSNTRHMVWSIVEQLVAITKHITLQPGDVVSTGTPAGVGSRTQTWLKPGDVLAGEIEGLEPLVIEITESTE